MFKRRDKLSLLKRTSLFFYPSKGWKRGIEYIAHRAKRLPDTSHRIALGIAAGVFISFTPLFGLHFITAAALAYVIRANVFASLIGTFLGNPVTFPFIGAFCLNIGRWMLGINPSHNDSEGIMASFQEAFWSGWYWIKNAFGYEQKIDGNLDVFFTELFLPYLIGGIIPGLITAAGFYFISRPAIAAYQRRRKEKLIENRKRQREAKKPTDSI